MIIFVQKKYSACKQHLSFCIPGFLVFRIATGTVEKFNKEYGRQLNKATVPNGKYILILIIWNETTNRSVSSSIFSSYQCETISHYYQVTYSIFCKTKVAYVIINFNHCNKKMHINAQGSQKKVSIFYICWLYIIK